MRATVIVSVIVGMSKGKPVLRSGEVAKVLGDGKFNVKVITEGKPEMDAGVDPDLVKVGECRVDSLMLLGIGVGTKIGCIVATEE